MSAIRRPSTTFAAARAALGVVLIIVNVLSGRYVLGVLGVALLIWTAVGLYRHRNWSDPAADVLP